MNVHVGPLPPPEWFREIEAICPGAAQEILSLHSERTRHRISIERDVINGDNARADRAQKIVAGLCVLTFICGSFFMYRGHSYEGAAIITGVLGSVLVAFLVGTASRKSERVEKARIMTGQKLPPPFDTKESVGTDS